MFIRIFMLFFGLCYCDDSDKVNETELVMTFLVHRHGDRSPLASFISVSNDPETLGRLTETYGYGQLTDNGRRCGYEVGKFIRRRYNDLLSPRYNKSEIYIRSTDFTRTKMTVLTAMAAVYPPTEDNWSKDINWTPVPYTTVPAKEDFNLAFENCPNFYKYYDIVANTNYTRMEKYRGMIDRLAPHIPAKLSENPNTIWMLNDLFTSQLTLGVPLSKPIAELMTEISEAALDAVNILTGNEEYLHLQAGVLLQEFFDAASVAISGGPSPRVRVYSAHDFNVYSFEAITQVTPRQGIVKYGAIFALELRRVVETGKYVVLPVYVTTPSEPEKYLKVKDCSALLCDFEEFYAITSKNARDLNTWRKECGYSEDMEVVVD